MSSYGRGFGHSNEQNSEGGRPSKFLYAGKNKKTDPWSTSDVQPEDGIEFSLQPQNKLLQNKESRNSSGFELNDVWSIRKNVQVTQASKKGKALNTNTSSPSYYSRHGGLNGTGDSESSLLRKKGQNGDSVGSSDDHKSWNVSTRSSYSYSDKPKFSGSRGSPDGQPEDILDNLDLVDKKNLINSKFRMAGAPQMTAREMSARTQRAQKMHDAHLRSMGMGQYASSNGSYTSSSEDRGKVSWRQKDDDFM